MSSGSTSTGETTAAATPTNHGGGTSISAIPPHVTRAHILNRLDGSTLASTTCASTELNSLCNEDELWRDICNSTWPSTADPRVAGAISAFPSGHHSFYSDSFPTLHHHGLILRQSSKQSQQQRLLETPELVSAVDIHYAGKLIYSRVVETETLSGWFLCSPLRIELLGTKETVPTPVVFDGEEGNCMELLEEKLSVSWIVIDPAHKRAVNLTSSRAVETRRSWLTEDIELQYSTVVAAASGELIQCGVLVTLVGKEGRELQIKEVSFQVEDMEGRIQTGIDSLVILQEAMQGTRRKSDISVEKERYQTLMKTRRENRLKMQRREKNLDVVYLTIGVAFFFSLWAYFCWPQNVIHPV